MSTDSDDGIDSPEAHDSPRFIEDKTLAQIAEKVRELINKYDAYPRFRESVKKCEKRQRDQIAAQVKWERKRREHARRAIKKARLLDEEEGRPGDDWRFQSFRGQDVAGVRVQGELSDIMAAWFPPELCWQSRPKVHLPPLPPHDGEMEPREKETALAAIHDYTVKGERKIADGLKLTHYQDLIGIESPVPLDNKYEGLVKQIPANNEHYLWAWLDDVEKDLQAQAAADADLPALSANASLVYELLLALPGHRAMTGPAIVKTIFDQQRVNLDESTLRKSIVPALEPYGLEHSPKIGYRIKPSRHTSQ